MIGSTLDARRAGIQLAKTATMISVPAAAPNDTGSVTPTPYTSPRRTRDTANAPAMPNNTPHATGRIESPTTMPRTDVAGAPSATRTPISFVLRVTAYDRTP